MANEKKKDETKDEQLITNPTTRVSIAPPNMRVAEFLFFGEAHLCVNRVSAKVRETLTKQQSEGGPARSKRVREAKDFKALFEAAQYRSKEGWAGIHAASIRCAAISACRTVGFKMTLAKLGIFTVADGYDRDDGTPLIRIWGTEPEMWIAPVRNATGVFDLRSRPRWNPGEWQLKPRIRFDADMFTLADITNLMMRIGVQVGLCEGRPDSKESAGLEYGLFSLAKEATEKAA